MDLNKLRNFDLQSFLNDDEKHNIFRLKKEYGNLSPILADQLTIYKQAATKLPLFAEKYCYFNKKSFEQSSSERAAQYKATLFSGNSVLDLTGGLGVDDWAFAKTFKKVISIDKESSLNELVRINFEKLGITNAERLNADAYEFIKTDASYDLIYIDADRRSSAKKAVTPENSEPNVLRILPRLFELSANILIKLSPLIDITYLIKILPGIKDIQVVSVDNEVKEVLVLLHKDQQDKTRIHAAELSGNETVKLFSPAAGTKIKIDVSDTGKYFYEPAASIIKAGLVNEYAAINGLNTISKNSVFLTGNVEIKDFIGRQFIIITQMQFGKSLLKKYLKEFNIVKANVSCRIFPVKEEEIKKSFGLNDGGDEYLFLTTGSEKQKIFFHCRKLIH